MLQLRLFYQPDTKNVDIVTLIWNMKFFNFFCNLSATAVTASIDKVFVHTLMFNSLTVIYNIPQQMTLVSKVSGIATLRPVSYDHCRCQTASAFFLAILQQIRVIFSYSEQSPSSIISHFRVTNILRNERFLHRFNINYAEFKFLFICINYMTPLTYSIFSVTLSLVKIRHQRCESEQSNIYCIITNS